MVEAQAYNETYQIIVQCANCGLIREKPIMIPIGKHWHNYLEENQIKCENCGVYDCYHRTT